MLRYILYTDIEGKGDPGPPLPLCINVSFAMELQLGVFGSLWTTHPETQTKCIRGFAHMGVFFLGAL